jgi:hypothetical protein
MSLRLRSAVAAAVLLLFAPALRADKRAFTIADLYRVKTVADPAISPDGHTVVYSVRTTDLPTSKAKTNLWRATPTVETRAS